MNTREIQKEREREKESGCEGDGGDALLLLRKLRNDLPEQGSRVLECRAVRGALQDVVLRALSTT